MGVGKVGGEPGNGGGAGIVCGWFGLEDFLHRVTLTTWEDSQWWRSSRIKGPSGDGGLGEWDTHYLFRIHKMYI